MWCPVTGRATSCSGGVTQMATLVERSSRFAVLVQLDGRDMHTVAAALSNRMNQVPAEVCP